MGKINSIHIANELLFEQVTEYLREGKDVTIRVKGNSMRPFLREGDKVLLMPSEGVTLSKGMIVLAKTQEAWVLHRVVQLNQQTVCLAGDANLAVHELIDYEDILAIVKSSYRGYNIVKLNNKWKYMLGLLWYQMRPFRRLMKKVFN